MGNKIHTLTFYSNYFNHHQKALCDEFYKLLGDGFKFVETMPMEGFRSSMGWGEDIPSYVIKTYESDENAELAMRLATESDLVIMGTAPEEYCEKRLELNKLTFRYSERPLKEGFIKFFIPRLTKKYVRMHLKNRDKNIYVLGASAFTAYDFRKMFNSYPGKCYKFGYFPKFIEYDIDELLDSKIEKAIGDANAINYVNQTSNNAGSADSNNNSNNNIYNNEETHPVSILWLGRMLKLKRPDLVIQACKNLKELGYTFNLHMVGEGEMLPVLKKLVKDYDMEDIVTFENFLSPDEARQRMSEYMIYVMTSNKLEGWGSVIYEALNAGCAVVASHICGATPWLVKDGKTGLVFKSGSVDSLTNKLKYLLDDPENINKFGKAAYENMKNTWNPENAAKSVIKLAEGLNAAGSDGRTKKYPDKQYIIKEGPCSKAGYLKNNWYNG